MDLGGTDPGPPGAEIISTTPELGATEADVLTTIRVVFSKRLREATVPGAVHLELSGRHIEADVVLVDNKTLEIVPTDPLDFGTTFQVRMDPTLEDRDGKLWSDQFLWDFTTEGSPPPTPSTDSLRHHLEALAHDSMLGRGSGTLDELRAALYMEGLFREWGLEAPGGLYLHSFVASRRGPGNPLSSNNVLAAAPGRGPLAGEWLVVGAHYDHVGVRELEDGTMGIHNGADDNGSGTVAVLELARLFQAYAAAGGMGDQDRRSVLFALFGAEEQGLLGSCHYVGSPEVPLSSTGAMMNFDMVGRATGSVVYVRGLETSLSLLPLVQNANEPDLLLDPTPACEGCSDHYCFWLAGIPFVWFFTGTHSDYHTPSDDADLINYEGLARIGEVSLRSLIRLAVMPTPPPFTGVIPDLPRSR
jgi:hypothetical protein